MKNCKYLQISNIFLVYGLCHILWNECAANGEIKPVTNDGMECAGKHQMPLNEKFIKAQERSYEQFSTQGMDRKPDMVRLENTGSTLAIRMNYTIKTKIMGGPFGDIDSFTFDFLYLYWLEKSLPEYDYKNVTFPAEFHLVFYNTKYSSFSEAGKMENGIAILAYPIKVAPYGSIYFSVNSQQLAAIREQYTYTDSSHDQTISLKYFINTDMSTFYTYHGSSVMLSCVKDVIWVDFDTPIIIKPEFVMEVEQMRAYDGTPLVGKMQRFETPKGEVFKSLKPSVSLDEFSAIPFIDTIDAATTSRMASDKVEDLAMFAVTLAIVAFYYYY